MWQVWLRLDDDQMLLDLAGALTAATVPEVERVLDADIRAAAGRHVRVGLAAIDCIDDRGLEMLRRCCARAGMRGVDLRIESAEWPSP
jgi:anti-anti-sigma regulatory factor